MIKRGIKQKTEKATNTTEEDACRKFIDNIEKFRSRWGLASGRLEEVSDGSAGKNSPFAQNLLIFLRTTPFYKIPISEIVQYVKINVPAEVSKPHWQSIEKCR